MEAGGSFLELACIRIAIVPAGQMSDARFVQLANQIDVVNELPSNALPKPQTNPRRTFLGGMSAMAATFSHAPLEFRAAQQLTEGSSPVTSVTPGTLKRSRSATRDNSAPRRTHSLSPSRSDTTVPASSANLANVSSSTSTTSVESSPKISNGTSMFGNSGAPSAAPSSSGASSSFASSPSLPAAMPSSAPSTSSAVQPSGSSNSGFATRSSIGSGSAAATSSSSASASTGLAMRLLSASPFGTDRFAQTITPQRRRWSNISSMDGEAGHVRLKYEIIHRDASGSTTMKPPSEWDSFHSRKVWGVIGVVDCTDPDASASTELVDRAISRARVEFAAALGHFRGVSVSRLVVFTTSDAVRESGTFVTEVVAVTTPSTSVPAGSVGVATTGISSSGGLSLPAGQGAASGAASSGLTSSNTALSSTGEGARPIMVGYVPMASASETRLEVRAQIIHFVGLVLASLEAWMQHESIATDLFLSPLDEHTATDNKSKLEKRRQGRLEKIQGDYYLMTGFAAEALTKFNSAIERARANGDSLWLAGAMEGAAAAQVYLHVAAGNPADDPGLVDRIIELYDEIFRMYRKKRVAELEAGAALRLAEYLGRWTSRRREAIESANLASNLGRELRSTKKQALWEALARFFEAMGCRRKAALYLYRLGQLDASQDVWTKAVTEITASARQFNGKGGGSWPSLHRRVLLEGAAASREAQDHLGAARHAVEALSLSPKAQFYTGESDSDVLRSLLIGPVPPVLRFADKLVDLTYLSPRQLASLSTRVYEQEKSMVVGSSSSVSRSGPFIYNPFEARRVAAIEAEASRAVTWICGETAHVSVSLKNQVHARLSVELIAIAVVSPEDQEPGILSVANARSEIDEDLNGIDSPSHASPSGTSLVGSSRVRAILHAANRVATTFSQTVILPSRGSAGIMTVDVSLIPRRPGPLHMYGILLRLFSGCVVMLRAPDVVKGGKPVVIEVMRPLPKLTISMQPRGLDSPQYRATSPPISMFEGELRLLRVLVTNNGPDDVTGAVIRARADKPERICILPVDQERGTAYLSIGGLKRGQSNSVDVQVYASRPSSQKDKSSNRLSERSRGARKPWEPIASTFFVDVEYIGQRFMSHYRTTSASINFTLAPAVLVENISVFQDASAHLILTHGDALSAGMTMFESSLRVGLLAEVTNHSSSPVQVSLLETCVRGDHSGLMVSSKEANERTCNAHNECCLERGGSGRLLLPIRGRLVMNSSKNADLIPLRLPKALYDGQEYALKWTLPALGRFGAVPIYRTEIQTAIMRELNGGSLDQPAWCVFTNRDTLRSATVNMTIKIGEGTSVALTSASHEQENDGSCDDGNDRGAHLRWHRPVVTRQYYDVKISIRNTSASRLPASSTMDVQLCQRDCRGAFLPVPAGIFIGTHNGVTCGSLEPGATFSHVVRLRLSSAGLFDIVATLHDGEPAPLAAGSDERAAFAHIEVDPELARSRGALSPAAVSGFAADANSGEVSPSSDSAGVSLHALSSQPRSPSSAATASGNFIQSPELAASTNKSSSQETSKSVLRRVGLTRKKKMEESKTASSPRGVNPFDLARTRVAYILPSEGRWCRGDCCMARGSAPLCFATLTLQALNDIRWSSGLLQQLENPVGKVAENENDHESSESAVSAHHGPDTIVH